VTPFLAAFEDELTKVAAGGFAGKALRTVAKVPGSIKRSPRKWIYGALAAMTAGGAAAAASAAKKRSRAGGDPRYIHATARGPSPAGTHDFHRYFKHDLTPKQKKRLHARASVALRGGALKKKKKSRG
jgi:hypothetical protein